MIKCLQILSSVNPQIIQWFKDSRSIYDQALYHQRQAYFTTIEYKKNPYKFTVKPSILKYLYKKTEFNLLQFDSTRLRNIDYKENSFCLPKFKKFRIKLPKWLDINQLFMLVYNIIMEKSR